MQATSEYEAADEESESQQQQSSVPVRDSQDDAELFVQPFGSRTQSDQPAQGVTATEFFAMLRVSCCEVRVNSCGMLDAFAQ